MQRLGLEPVEAGVVEGGFDGERPPLQVLLADKPVLHERNEPVRPARPPLERGHAPAVLQTTQPITRTPTGMGFGVKSWHASTPAPLSWVDRV